MKNKTERDIFYEMTGGKGYMVLTGREHIRMYIAEQTLAQQKRKHKIGQAKGVETKLQKRKEAKLYLQYLMAEHGIKKLTRSNVAILLPEMHQKGYRYSLESLYNMI